MCHFAVKIEEKCAFLAHRNIGLIMLVIFVMRTIWRLMCETMRVRVYRGICNTHTPPNFSILYGEKCYDNWGRLGLRGIKKI